MNAATRKPAEPSTSCNPVTGTPATPEIIAHAKDLYRAMTHHCDRTSAAWRTRGAILTMHPGYTITLDDFT